MAAFFCQRCDQLADSHDGAEDRLGKLLCVDCCIELDDEKDDLPNNLGEGEV